MNFSDLPPRKRGNSPADDHSIPLSADAVRQFAAEQVRYLSSEGKGRAPDIVRQVLVNLAQSLIGSNEFLYLE
ncbi:MAG UNVERIFIED_CONTAM: hypothetical protein LVR18_34705 [Planctomycetaceae bacterium]